MKSTNSIKFVISPTNITNDNDGFYNDFAPKKIFSEWSDERVEDLIQLLLKKKSINKSKKSQQDKPKILIKKKNY